MPDDPYDLKKLSKKELYTWTAGWKITTDKHIAGQQEIRRRNEAPINQRAWVAIGIASLSLIVAIIALVSK
ncbi:hypothetical protein [Dasania marina]|uniref:hypothetical protein n=1 Tax=Dasania marina TaxID=471499 RepID=UPI00037B6DFA|nr:hypothetical protein [Dasania marina]